MVSIMCLCGLPMIVGVFLVEYRSGADIDPEPETQRYGEFCGLRGVTILLTWVECTSSGIRCIRVCEDELASRVVHDIRVRLGVLFVVYQGNHELSVRI